LASSRKRSRKYERFSRLSTSTLPPSLLQPTFLFTQAAGAAHGIDFVSPYTKSQKFSPFWSQFNASLQAADHRGEDFITL
jgi:hypothetical protein